MSRGRAIAGDAALWRASTTCSTRSSPSRANRRRLPQDVASMRARIEREKPAASPFDVKLAPGGLMDCEFAAQFLVLSGLRRVAGETTLETLKRAADEGRRRRGRASGSCFPPRCKARSCSLSASPTRGLLSRQGAGGAEAADRGCAERARSKRPASARSARGSATFEALTERLEAGAGATRERRWSACSGRRWSRERGRDAPQPPAAGRSCG